MANRGGRKTEKADALGGGFFLLPHCLLKSAAFRTASPRAIKVLMALLAEHNGFNNGSIGLGRRDLGKFMGNQNHAANSAALYELVERGIVALEKVHLKAKRLAWEYRLTFVPTASGPATNDYLAWRESDAGTRNRGNKGKIPVEDIATPKAVRVENIATGEETSRCEDLNGVHEKAPFFEVDRVAITSTHICNHLSGSEGDQETSPESPLLCRGHLSGAPDADELRGRTLNILEASRRGSQGQLAALAAIRPAALSKYLHERGSLNDGARLRLTLALPKLQAAAG